MASHFRKPLRMEAFLLFSPPPTPLILDTASPNPPTLF
uniref:Uncharacterized protein n=1 Tax=Anguilla anguilla TaxID=7936 RepID=A0A0E9XQ47_ANGAN